MAFQFRNIEVVPGVQPDTDFTNNSTPHWVAADKIRFVDGFPEKIGGWESVVIANGETIEGCPRSIFSYIINKTVRYLIGTHTNLYDLNASTLTNITPLDATTTNIANSLDSNFGTLANDPLTTASGTNIITVADTGTKVRAGDTIDLSGSAGFNGIPAGEFNTTHFVRTQGPNSYTFFVSSNASSSGSGGGAAVVQATPIVTVNFTAHGEPDGARTALSSAAGFAGIPAGDLNIEHIIRNPDTNTFDIVVDTIATSSVTGGGGAATDIQVQIGDGACDASFGQGYGMGLYGVGLYGVSKSSSGIAEFPRRWSFDRFGNNVILTPGSQTGTYTYDSITTTAPTVLANAPTAINYVFVSNEIVVTLGDSNVGNRVKWSDQGDSTDWTAVATNLAGEDDIEGASEFLSHLKLKDLNLLFTESQVYTMRFIGKPLVWEFKLLDEKSGIIAQNARVSHNGIAYWMGDDNFYFYRGGNVEVIPSNSTGETTLKKFVFDDINTGQKSKIFAWFNRAFNEVWWHYPSTASNEPDKIVRFNVRDFTWTPDTLDRTAAEYPSILREFPRLVDINGVLYDHEKGFNDGLTTALPFSLSTPFFNSGTTRLSLGAFMPDSIQTGDISVSIISKKYQQSTNTQTKGPFTVTPTTEKFTFLTNPRYWQYQITGNALDQEWVSGTWAESLQQSTRR